MLNPSNPGVHKFVRVGGEYRFTAAENEHNGLVKVGEKVESAGMIYVFDDHWRFADMNYSTTLGLGTDELDPSRLTEIIGKPQKER